MATREEIADRRNELTLDLARKAGWLGETKDARLGARVSAKLVEAAKKAVHVESDSELLEIALSRLVLEDDFGPRILKRKGRLAKAENLEL